MKPRIGGLFAGYGGLDEAVAEVFDGEIVWFSEYEPPTKSAPRPKQAPARILAHHWPDVPNHGDITKIDWTTVEPVDILTGGFPCQDVSLAGLRRGLQDGTRSGLWSYFAQAIDVLRPSYVVIENVRGLASAPAGASFSEEEISDLESFEGDLGELLGNDRPVLRALGAVLGDLADLGYDAEWCGLRAADAGAPHGRFRIFILAHPEGDGGSVWFSDGDFVRSRRPDRLLRTNTGAGATSDPGRDEPERWGRPGEVGGTQGSNAGTGEERQRIRNTVGNSGGAIANPNSDGFEGLGWQQPSRPRQLRTPRTRGARANF